MPRASQKAGEPGCETLAPSLLGGQQAGQAAQQPAEQTGEIGSPDRTEIHADDIAGEEVDDPQKEREEKVMSFLAFQEAIQAGIAGQKPSGEPAAGKPADPEGNGEIHRKA